MPTLRYLLLLAVLTSACSETTPPEPVQLTLVPDTLKLTSVETSGVVEASTETRTTSQPALRMISENRWVSDIPVLHPDSLARGRIWAVSPGSATLKVSAFGGSNTLVVLVTHPRPLLLQVDGPTSVGWGDTITLSGFRVDSLANKTLLLGTSVLTPVGGDSARLRVRVGTSPNGRTCVREPSDTIVAPAADIPRPLAVQRRRANELRIAIGEARLLTEAEQACLILPVGTNHALAFLDTRTIEQARLPRLQRSILGDYEISLTVPDTFSGGGVRRYVTKGGAVIRSRVVESNAVFAYEEPYLRAQPWVIGEEISLDPSKPQAQARVERIYDGRYVVAADTTLPADSLRVALAALDTVFPRFLAGGEPLYRKWFSPNLPRTSPGSGQLLIIIGRGCSGNQVFNPKVDAARPSLWVVLYECSLATSTPAWYAEQALLHELAHVWQIEYLHPITPAGQAAAADDWAWEGGAQYARIEVLRRRGNLPLLGNLEWGSFVGLRTEAGALAQLASAWGTSSFGGASVSASFMQDLITRRVRAGEDVDAATGHILRTSLHGWFGMGDVSKTANGFVDEMRTIEPGWDPADALLRWTLSLALDDLTDSPVLQNLTFRNVQSREPPALHALRFDAPLNYNVRFRRFGGSPDYVLLISQMAPSAYVISANVPGVKWMIARLR